MFDSYFHHAAFWVILGLLAALLLLVMLRKEFRGHRERKRDIRRRQRERREFWGWS